jgi:hypothetical protein
MFGSRHYKWEGILGQNSAASSVLLRSAGIARNENAHGHRCARSRTLPAKINKAVVAAIVKPDR